MTDKISTIDKIVTASIELFANKSYANTTLQDISKSSGAAIGSIYHAFPKGKSVIAELITERYFDEYKQNLLSILKTDIVGQSFEKLINDLFDILLKIDRFYIPFSIAVINDNRNNSNWLFTLFYLRVPTKGLITMRLKIGKFVRRTFMLKQKRQQNEFAAV